MTRERVAACDSHAEQRVEFVDRYENFRPTECPWCRIALLEASLHDLLKDYDQPYWEQNDVAAERAARLLRAPGGPVCKTCQSIPCICEIIWPFGSQSTSKGDA